MQHTTHALAPTPNRPFWPQQNTDEANPPAVCLLGPPRILASVVRHLAESLWRHRRPGALRCAAGSFHLRHTTALFCKEISCCDHAHRLTLTHAMKSWGWSCLSVSNIEKSSPLGSVPSAVFSALAILASESRLSAGTHDQSEPFNETTASFVPCCDERTRTWSSCM